MLGWRSVVLHQIPRADRRGTRIGIMVQVWRAQGVVHLVAHRRRVEIACSIGQLEIECPHYFPVDVNIPVGDEPFMRPKQGIPRTYIAFHDETDIVDIAVIVIVYIQVSGYWIITVDIVHGSLKQRKFALRPLLFQIPVGICACVVRLVITAGISVLIRNDGGAAVSGIESGRNVNGVV